MNTGAAESRVRNESERLGPYESCALTWIIIAYLERYILYLMPVIRQMLGSWTELEVSVWFLPGTLIGMVLIYTSFNRVAEAGLFLRWIWKCGRWLLIGAYAWSAAVLLALNVPVLLRADHRHFDALLVLLIIDLLAVGYLLVSASARQFFDNFPTADDVAAQEAAAKLHAQDRQQFIRDARLGIPIAQNSEEERIEAYWRAEIQRDTRQALPWLELGVLAYKCGKVEQALGLMERALEAEPDNHLVLRNLCELLRQKGRLDKALSYGEKAVALAPNDEIVRLNLAQVLVDRKELDRAISQYHRILELNPRHVQTWINLAIFLQKQGRGVDAMAALDAVLLIEPWNEQVQTLKKQLI